MVASNGTTGLRGSAPPRRPPPPPPASSDTTRYLCAATHLDRHYRRRVVDATLRDAHQAVCPSYGVDLAVVARHAAAAHHRALLQDFALATILIVGVVFAVSGLSETAITALFNGRPGPFAAAVQSRLPLGLYLLGVAYAVVVAEIWSTMTTLGRYLRPGGRPDLAPGGVGSGVARRLETLAAVNVGNVVVYSGFRPFVGSGLVADQGSYAIPLLPASSRSEGGAPVAFRAGELVAAVLDQLEQIGLSELRLERLVFVGGLDVDRFPELLPDPRSRPVVSASPDLIRRLTEHPTGAARSYLCARATAWRGQLVVSNFIRIVVLNGVIFVETATLVLPPLRPRYLEVDTMRIRTPLERLGATLVRSAAFPFRLLCAPFRLVAVFESRWAAWRRYVKTERRISDRVRFDRGAVSSIREEAGRNDINRYFMQLDAEMAMSVVQQRVADTIAEFLDERGYRTEKIKLIQNNISNMTVNDNSVRLSNNRGTIVGVGRGARGTATAPSSQAAGSGGTG
jgi:hypothetical protein